MSSTGRRGLLALSALAAACGAPPPEAAPAPPEPGDYRTRDLRDEVVYQVLIDRFADALPEPDELPVRKVPGDLARIQGGDWEGLRRRLDYVRGLGMTALWLSPIFENTPRAPGEDGYHGYWASDFTRLNPYFGTLADLQALVRDAHGRGLRVFLDIAPNHTGPVFHYDLDGDGAPGDGELEPPFASTDSYERVVWDYARPALFTGRAAPGDALDGPSPRLARWELEPRHFHRRGRTEDFTDAEQVLRGDFPNGLRDLATEDPAIVAAFVDTFVEWVRLTDVDGFRLDAVPHAEHAFWAALCAGLRERLTELGKPDFFIFGEVFRTEPDTLASYTTGGSMDSVLDFAFKFDVVQRYVLEGGPASATRAALETNRAHFTEPAWQKRLSFADNHDTGRVLGALNDPYAAEVALTLVFTVDAIPTVYYGSEQGFAGGPWHASREPLWWSDYALDVPLARHVRRLSDLRAESPALRYGELVIRHAGDTALLAFERRFEGESVLVATNADALATASARVPTGFTPGATVRDALGADGASFRVGGAGEVDLLVPPRQALVLVDVGFE